MESILWMLCYLLSRTIKLYGNGEKLVLVYKSERSIAVVGRVFVASKRVVEPIEMDLPRLAIKAKVLGKTRQKIHLDKNKKTF